MIRHAVAATAAVALFAAAAHSQESARRAVRPRVVVFATGGTISNLGGSDDNRRTGTELVGGVPRIAEIADVSVIQLTNVASSSLTHEIWRTLATRINEMQRSSDAPVGFVVTQGTDTMEETAFFLSLTTGGCSPVVITGAMRQANATGADGPANLLNAVRVAIAPSSRGRGTMVLMNDEIFAARDVTKSNSTRPNAFTAPDAGVLGVADPDTIVYHRASDTANASSTCRAPVFELGSLGSFPRVDVAYAYIGADSVVIDAEVKAGARGIVVAGVGRGGTTPAMGRALRRATEQGVMVAMTTRTGSGRVGRETDPDSLNALPAGRGAMMGASDLNAQKARILLMLGLAAHTPLVTLARLFEQR